MKQTIKLIISISCIVKSNEKTINVSEEKKSTTILTEEIEKKEIELLIRCFYKSYENIGFATVDAHPISDWHDSIYIGLDSVKILADINILKNTNYFSDEFIENWQRIAFFLDNKLKNKYQEWIVGDMSPFWGSDVDRWCLCQDIPSDDFWENMQFNFLEINSQEAILTWTWDNSEWSENFNYKIRTTKKNGKWQISYMQGFDISNYL